LAVLVLDDLSPIKPQSDLLLSVLNAVGSVADIAADVNGKITTDGTRSRCKGVGCTKESAASLDSITTFPHHCADGPAQHVGDEAIEEWFIGQISVMLLQVLLGWGHELDGSKLIPAVLKSADDGPNKTTLNPIRLNCDESLFSRHVGRIEDKAIAD